MAKKRPPVPRNLLVWIEARKRFRLSDAQVQMARELGMNPKKFGKLANHRQEPWKMPLPQYIERLYEKRFGKPQPDRVLSIENRVAEKKEKKRRKKKLRLDEAAGERPERSGGTDEPETRETDDSDIPF